MNTVEAFLAVKNTVNDLGNFCERNSDTCETGKTFFGSLGERARDGAKLAYEYLDRTFGSNKSDNKMPPENINTGSITSEDDHEKREKVDNKSTPVKSVPHVKAADKLPSISSGAKHQLPQKPQ